MKQGKIWAVLAIVVAAGCTGEGVLNDFFGGGTGSGGSGGSQADGETTVDQVIDPDWQDPVGRPLPDAGPFSAQARNETDRAVLVTMEFVYNDTVVHVARRRVAPGRTTALIGPETAEFVEAEAKDFDGNSFPSATLRFGVDADESTPALYVVRQLPTDGNGNDNAPDNTNQNVNVNDNVADNQNQNDNVADNQNDNTKPPGGGGGGPTPIIDCNNNGTADGNELCVPEIGQGDIVSEYCFNNEDDDDDDLVDCADPDCRNVPGCCTPDCNGNRVPDECDIASGTAPDCNENGALDECDIAYGTSEDCQPNGVPDECDIALGNPDGVRGLGDPTRLLFPLDSSYTLALGPNDDGSTGQIALPFTFDFYGSSWTGAFINNNGNISFGQPFGTFTATGFPILGFPMLAPFWADVDTGDQFNGLGAVWYKTTSNTLIVTWDNVGYYSLRGDKRNTFQVAISDGTNPVIGLGNNVAFSYDEMEWTTGDASGGTNGFGGTAATVGANRGNGADSFPIGRFDHEGADYSGPASPTDGVSYLDGRTFLFSTAITGGVNISPIATGFPVSGIVTAFPSVGGTLDRVLQFLSPEEGQVTRVSVADPNGAVGRGLVITNTPGNVAVVDLAWAPDCEDAGLYALRFTATDDFSPPGSTQVSLTIRVDCGSTDCNNNGIPDECEIASGSATDCNENGVLDECDIRDGTSPDCNSNGFPDECDTGTRVLCELDADCDDEQFCNGAETCRNGQCLLGCPPCPPNYYCEESKDYCSD